MKKTLESNEMKVYGTGIMEKSRFHTINIRKKEKSKQFHLDLTRRPQHEPITLLFGTPANLLADIPESGKLLREL